MVKDLKGRYSAHNKGAHKAWYYAFLKQEDIDTNNLEKYLGKLTVRRF